MKGGAGAVGIGDFARDATGFVGFMRRWTENFDDFAIELDEIIDAANERVVAITRQRGTGKASRADRPYTHRRDLHARHARFG